MQHKDLITFHYRWIHMRAFIETNLYGAKTQWATAMIDSTRTLLVGTRFVQCIEPMGINIDLPQGHTLLARTNFESHKPPRGSAWGGPRADRNEAVMRCLNTMVSMAKIRITARRDILAANHHILH